MRLSLCGVLAATLFSLSAPATAQAPFNVFGLMDGSQAVPPTTSAANGIFAQAHIPLPFGQWMGAGFASVIGLQTSALDVTHGANNTAMHIHAGAPGSAGPLVFDADYWGVKYDYSGGYVMLIVGFYTQYQGAHNMGMTTSQLINTVQSGDVFFNVHTLTHRTGEIRADLQVL
ncbi:MAG: CHRD domain-containing protein [Planctomycetota bacterium]